ncbi:MAG: GyrI-like domain-containing protein [Oscillospiraceae bacterium]|nr:GyrI-like domain-containing protein [Oscillospiraceae bacterium]
MATAFDYKKEYKDLYQPKKGPGLIRVPAMQFVAVEGKGDPNAENGAYANAMALLYGISFTIKMSYLGAKKIEGYFPYVVPPLEGLWWMADGMPGIDYGRKSEFCWISMIRLPEFVDQPVFDWAKEELARKKKLDPTAAHLFHWEEGLCVQAMHTGPYDSEPSTVKGMVDYAGENGLQEEFVSGRYHHEIYLSDPRRTAPEKLKTIIRHPVKKA